MDMGSGMDFRFWHSSFEAYIILVYSPKKFISSKRPSKENFVVPPCRKLLRHRDGFQFPATENIYVGGGNKKIK